MSQSNELKYNMLFYACFAVTIITEILIQNIKSSVGNRSPAFERLVHSSVLSAWVPNLHRDNRTGLAPLPNM